MSPIIAYTCERKNMKLKLTLLLLTAISTLHAGSFKLTDITTPTTKACADLACVLGAHSGKVALATGVLAVLTYRHADIELKKIDQHRKYINELQAAVLKNDQSDILDGYYPPSLRDPITNYHDACKQLQKKERALGISSVQARVEFARNHNKTLPKNFSKTILDEAQKKADKAEQDLKAIEADDELQKIRQKVAELETTLNTSFKDKLLALNKERHQAYYAKLWYCGVCIALASLLSYSVYKAYPKLHTWYSAYVNPTVANAA